MAIEINGKVAEIYPDSFVYRVKNHQGVDVGEFKTCDVKDWSLPKIENPVKYNNKFAHFFFTTETTELRARRTLLIF